jgi:hypothetical protein
VIRAKAVVVLALIAMVLRTLCAHVTILPGVVVPVAGLLFATELAVSAGLIALAICRALRSRTS